MVNTNFRVIELVISGHLKALNKFVKFQSYSRFVFELSSFLSFNIDFFSKPKREDNLININFRVMALT